MQTKPPSPQDFSRFTAPSEERNPRTVAIDQVSTIEVLQMINHEDYEVPRAVAAVLPELARAVDMGLTALRAGGRIHYAGAGASGRIGFVDRAELVPTYAIEPDQIVAHLAGGLSAMGAALEDVEDDHEAGSRAITEIVQSRDLVVGLAASGHTPYVEGALRSAREAGAATVLISANPAAPLAPLADVHAGIDTGPEAIAGSTRMKAATAQKMALNAFSTAIMVGLGRTYSNFMVDMLPLNGKLRGRLISILVQATDLPEADCRTALAEAGGEVKVALVALLGTTDPATARAALGHVGGNVRAALAHLDGPAAAGVGQSSPYA
ncbi:N-acetylmuramic acid 6-phosphate etherase [Nonomuraea sp. NPDC003707]